MGEVGLLEVFLLREDLARVDQVDLRNTSSSVRECGASVWDSWSRNPPERETEAARCENFETVEAGISSKPTVSVK